MHTVQWFSRWFRYTFPLYTLFSQISTMLAQNRCSKNNDWRQQLWHSWVWVNFFIFLSHMHKCVSNFHVCACRICLCDKCVSCSYIQWKRQCLSLASTVVPRPSFQIIVRNATATLMSQAKNPVITLSSRPYSWIFWQIFILFYVLLI